MAQRSDNKGGGEAFESSWRTRFEEFAADHDDDAGIAGWTRSGLEARLRRFAGLWKHREKGDRWLDAGCGAGTYTRLLRTQGAEVVVGVDYSLPTILKARARTAPDVAYAVGDVRQLPFRPHSFDGVLCFGVTQALSDTVAAIGELAAQIEPAGQLWVDALNRWCVVHAWDLLRRRLSGRPIHLRYESPWVIRRIMASRGLMNIEIHWMPIVPARWPRLQRGLEGAVARWIFRYAPLVGLFFSHAFIVRAETPAPRTHDETLPPPSATMCRRC